MPFWGILLREEGILQGVYYSYALLKLLIISLIPGDLPYIKAKVRNILADNIRAPMIAAIIRMILTTSSQVGISEKANLLNTDIGAVMGIMVRMVLITWSELSLRKIIIM